MAPPPRDTTGKVIPHDDPDILDADGLIRHIHPVHHYIVDKNTGKKRLSTGAFSESSKPPGGMSVNLERPMSEAGLDCLANIPAPEFGAVRLIAGDVRNLGHKVGSSPLPHNPYHGEVWNIGPGKAAKRRLMEKIQWVRFPTSVNEK